MTNAHERFMQVAMEEARIGAAEGNAAVGSAVVRDGNLIARGRNLVMTQSDPTAHAETVALRNAGAAMGHTDFSLAHVRVSSRGCSPKNVAVSSSVHGSTASW